MSVAARTSGSESRNWKGMLQEWLQKQGVAARDLPVYKISSTGPPHDPKFSSVVSVRTAAGETYNFKLDGAKTKKEAEASVAEKAYQALVVAAAGAEANPAVAAASTPLSPPVASSPESQPERAAIYMRGKGRPYGEGASCGTIKCAYGTRRPASRLKSFGMGNRFAYTTRNMPLFLMLLSYFRFAIIPQSVLCRCPPPPQCPFSNLSAVIFGHRRKRARPEGARLSTWFSTDVQKRG